jgi:hypothetical protein
MAIKDIVLPDGRQVVIDQWLHYPLFSTVELGQTGGSSDPFDLKLFSYVRGQRVPQTANVPAAPFKGRIADERDTNMQKRAGMNYDEAFIFYGFTYEIFGLTNATFDIATSPLATTFSVAQAPAVDPTNLKRLDRDVMIELTIGAGQKAKPTVRAPWSYLRQSIGAPAWSSGDTVAPNVHLDAGSGGRIGPRNQRQWEFPISIDSMQVVNCHIFSSFGVVSGLTQSLRFRVYMDGLKRRPID